MSLKSRIEAILFLTDKPLRAQAICKIVNEDVHVVRQAILELIHDYESRQSGLEITDDNGYMLQVKDEYASIIDEFVPMELPTALIRTLSAVAIKQPIQQSEIVKLRGAGAYDHIKDLLERELISKREEGGRSPILTTTKKFQEYFRLSKDAKHLRDELKEQTKQTAAGDESNVQPLEGGALLDQATSASVPDDTADSTAERSDLDMLETQVSSPNGVDDLVDSSNVDTPEEQAFAPPSDTMGGAELEPQTLPL